MDQQNEHLKQVIKMSKEELLRELEFSESQVKYYKTILNCGHSRDWNLILGLKQYYEREVSSLREQLIKREGV